MGAVIVAGRYVPRPPDDNIWNVPPARGIPEFYLPAGGGFPFVNKRAAYSDDPAVWYRNGSSFAALRLPAVTVLPFSNQRPAYSDDASVWQNKTAPVAPVGGLVNGNFPFIATRWTGNYDDASSWQNESVPVPPVNRLVGGNFPFRASFWTSYDETPVFCGRSFVVPIQLFPAVAPTPFVPIRWEFDHAQPAEWVGKSWPSFWALVQSFQLYVPGTTRQIPPGEEPNVWVGNSAQVNNRLLSAQPVPAPVTPQRWRYDYDDTAVWSGAPNAAAILRIPASVAPFVPVRWKFDYDDASFWSRNSRFSQTLLITPPPTFFGAVGQSPWHKWNFDCVPPDEWSGKPTNAYSVNQPLPPVITLGKRRPTLFMSNLGRMMGP